MEISLKWDITEKRIITTNEESDLWQKVGEQLLTLPVPTTLTITTPVGDAKLNIGKRGTYIKDGVKHPSMYVQPVFNNIRCDASMYEEKYLTCVNPEGNNYKFYRLLPQNSGGHTVAVDAEYGSIDTDTCAPRRLQTPYESYLFWIRYYEKLSKGYTDMTKFHAASQEQAKKKVTPGESKDKSANAILYRMLMGFAHHHVQESLQNPASVTQAQVKEARKEFNKMCSMKTRKGFCTHLTKLLALSPRSFGNRALGNSHLQSMMPRPTHSKEALQDEFLRIIDREENLLLAMEALVGMEDVQKTAEKVSDSFKQFGIHVWIATQEQEKEVKDCLPPSLQSKIKTIYRVKPEKQEKAFSEYCKRNHIRQIKKLWHGSRNENWASIIQNSLTIRPTAANGRMFGDGLYFAPSPNKSWNYTSYRGTTWAHGNADTAFMGLYATAYGDPLMVRTSGHYTQAQLKSSGHNCVHATAANTGLRADEIIYYDPNAVCLNYLVEFK